MTTTVDWARCGTEANAKAHRRALEKPCRRCRAAEREAEERRRARKPLATSPIPPEIHGTTWGTNAHYRRGEKPCQRCLDAYNAAQRRYSKTGSYVS